MKELWVWRVRAGFVFLIGAFWLLALAQHLGVAPLNCDEGCAVAHTTSLSAVAILGGALGVGALIYSVVRKSLSLYRTFVILGAMTGFGLFMSLFSLQANCSLCMLTDLALILGLFTASRHSLVAGVSPLATLVLLAIFLPELTRSVVPRGVLPDVVWRSYEVAPTAGEEAYAVFSDPSCPHCKDFHKAVKAARKGSAIKIYYRWVLRPQTMTSSLTAVRFFELVVARYPEKREALIDAIFARQGVFDANSLGRIATAVGIDPGLATLALGNDEATNQVIKADGDAANVLGYEKVPEVASIGQGPSGHQVYFVFPRRSDLLIELNESPRGRKGGM